MKSLISIGSLATAAVFLIGCKPISGTLKVHEPITVKVTELIQEEDPFCRIDPEQECPWKEVIKDVNVKAGSMKAKLDQKSKTKISLILDGLKNDPSVIFKVPKGFKIPERNGEFHLKSKQVGQPFDLHGLVNTKVTESKEYRGWERCTYTEQRRVCRTVPPRCRTNREGRTICRGGGQRCHWENVTVWGDQRVEYYYRQTDRDINIGLMEPGQSNASAEFVARQRWDQKVYTYKGRCR